MVGNAIIAVPDPDYDYKAKPQRFADFELSNYERCTSLAPLRARKLRQPLGGSACGNKNMSMTTPISPAFPAPADHGVDSRQAFERKASASPVSPLWSPECDGSKTSGDLSLEQRCYSVGPSTGASPAGSSTTSSWRASPCNGRSPVSPGTSASTLRSLETSRFTGPASRPELCTLKPPLASKGLEVKMPPAPSSSPAPSESPAPQSTYVSPPMIFAQPRPWKPEQAAGASHATPSFTLNTYRGISL